MIRIYSANLTAKDYAKLSRILTTGLNMECYFVHDCDKCNEYKVCKAVWNAIAFCDKKAAEMVEP